MTDYHKTPSSTILNIPLPPEEEALRVLRDCLDNEEIVHVVERYVLDEEPTDLQRMMLDGAARERVVGELGKIAEVANWSLAESLRDAADGTITNLNMIAGTQLKVDSVAGALRDAGSRLYAEDTYPTPDDSAYWDREAGFIAGRKESGDSRWNTVSDVEDIESIRAEAQSYEPLLEAILQDAIGRAEAKDSVVGMSHRVKGVESLVNKVKKFRQTEWGANATVADAVKSASGLILRGGGHGLAAGVTLLAENIPAFRARVNEFYRSLGLLDQERYLLPSADVELGSFTGIDEQLVSDIAKLEPFGNGNSEPVLKVADTTVVAVRQMGADGQHVKLTLRGKQGQNLQVLAFNADKEFFRKVGDNVSAWFQPNLNEWNGMRSVEGRLLHIESA